MPATTPIHFFEFHYLLKTIFRGYFHSQLWRGFKTATDVWIQVCNGGMYQFLGDRNRYLKPWSGLANYGVTNRTHEVLHAEKETRSIWKLVSGPHQRPNESGSSFYRIALGEEPARPGRTNRLTNPPKAFPLSLAEFYHPHLPKNLP